MYIYTLWHFFFIYKSNAYLSLKMLYHTETNQVKSELIIHHRNNSPNGVSNASRSLSYISSSISQPLDY